MLKIPEMANILPPTLKPGDRIAIISPATIVKPEYIDGAAAFLRNEGFIPVIMPHAKGPSDGSYAASDEDRLADLTEAYRDPSIRAILCARGGYGCNHLILSFPEHLIADNPKWLIGFSDITALHAMSLRNGVISLHAPMAKHLATLQADHYCTDAMMKILREGLPMEYVVNGHPLSLPGSAEGTLVGGNLAVFNGLADTPYDPLRVPGPKILFIEDISEAIYAVERMLIRLALSGRLSEVTGIVIGHFTEYRADRNFTDMESMIRHLFSKTLGSRSVADKLPLPEIPIAFGFPAGHTDDNLPLPLGAWASLGVSAKTTRLSLMADNSRP